MTGKKLGRYEIIRTLGKGAMGLVYEGHDPVLQRLANEVQGPSDARSRSKGVEMLQPLTPRELEVLELVALGLTNREIAQRFVLGVGTVKNHVEHIIAKLGVSDRTQAVVKALELGILDLSWG